MNLRLLVFSIITFTSIAAFSQNKIDLEAYFDVEKREITISQTIQYFNDSYKELSTVYLNDWNNSYSTKNTALAKRLADEYNNEFHLAKNEDRGYSVISSIKQNGKEITFQHVKNQIDIIELQLAQAVKPRESYTIHLNYLVKIPKDKFTSYGITPEGDFNLRYWYITPAVYNGTWQYFSNKNLDDLFIPKADLNLKIEYPKAYKITTELNTIKETENKKNKIVTLHGKDRINNKLYLSKASKYKSIKSTNLEVVSDIQDDNIELIEKVLISEKINNYIFKNLGNYPHEKLLLSEIDNEKDPVYGLNFLPKFVQAYPNTFKYELKILKLSLHNYLENTLLINPRKDQWLTDGIQIYYLMKYVEENYPKMKFLGSLANFWGVRSFHAADLNYNDKYTLAFMLMARTNRDQPLTMQKDSLLKFNKNISGKYKAGIGLKYLDDFINNDVIETSIKTFIDKNKLKETNTKAFENHIKSNTDKNIDWFFKDYLNTRKKIDFKIKNIKKTDDSITLTIKNKRNNSMPISLFSLSNDSIVSKLWIENIKDKKTITIPKNNSDKLALNYNNAVPEFNLRDNWKSLKGFFFNNKPLQVRLFQDVEDPYYNQIFFMPIVEFNNIYDGVTLGSRLYNRTLLRKKLYYKFEPTYSLKSQTFTWSVATYFTHNIENSNLYSINYGIKAGYKSYAENLFVRQITPSVTFKFRQDNDFRSNKKESIFVRYIDTQRDEDPLHIATTSEPDYSIFNARYIKSNDNLINFSKWYTDFQIGKNFSKVALNYEYRRLFESNRQLNLRFFAGSFLSNNNDENSDYFSFALDRPTDYLFDYSYLGRSEASGIFSQQYITAEGGFKSKLETPFANQWMTTINTSTTLWKYILVYSDLGLLKNKHNKAKFVYDSGLRVNLVTDYFEIYFPIYSNLGWEMGQPNYSQSIRFKFTLDPKSLLGLFRRKWY
ncbi:hypothetical protein GCM10022291_03210 [Postechiella marina]|uniref:Metalloprotease n=1 Tax=Postechiella marina TaxID=943941 RepID=A0ABP8C0I4_9FLAO